MDPLTYSEFSAIIGAKPNGAEPPADVVVRHIATHSRRIHSESTFFALGGSDDDGSRWAADALQNGAALVVAKVGRCDPSLLLSGRVLEVHDPLSALHELAGWWRAQLDATVVAVVGTNGKTITKDALAHLLGPAHAVYTSPGSYNSQLGVALALLGCPGTAELAVVELAVNNPGEMARLEAMVRPDYVVMTNLGLRWRSRFTDREHQAREILSICENLTPDQWLLVGEQDPAISRLTAASPYRCFVRGDRQTLPWFSEPHYEREGLAIRAQFPDGRSRTVGVRTPSAEILTDVELAAGAAWLLGVGSDPLLSALDGYTPTSTRTEIWRTPRGTTLIRDVATPDAIAVGSGVRAARRVASPGGRVVVILSEDLRFVDITDVQALADVLQAEDVERVYALTGRLSKELQRVGGALDPAVRVDLFDTTDDLRRVLDGLDTGDVALLQSPPTAPIGDLSARLIESIAPTRLYIDLSAMEDNVLAFRRIIGPSVRLMAVLKAQAYGTDSVIVASALEGAGVDSLGVSSADEGVALRRGGITLPILVMLPMSHDVEKIVQDNLTPLVYSDDVLDAVLRSASNARDPIRVHVEFDTGMHRTGFPPGAARAVLTRLRDMPQVTIEGIMTHLSCADEPAKDKFTTRQLEEFQRVLATAAELGLGDVIRHAAATPATIRFPDSHLDMVRIGIGLHGVHPSEATRARVDLLPAFGLVSRIIQISELREGDLVGYGGTYRVPAGGARIGVVPAGYNDEVARGFSNRGHVNVAGVDCPIVGSVSMDSMTVDVSNCPDAHVSSDVLILGRHGSRVVAPEPLAGSIDTIAYELMVRIGERVQRIITRH